MNKRLPTADTPKAELAVGEKVLSQNDKHSVDLLAWTS